MSDDHDRLFPLNYVARHCNVSTRTVRVWCRTARIDFVILPNGHYRVKKSAIEKITCLNRTKAYETDV